MSDLLDKALALADAVSVEAYARINRDEIEAQIAASDRKSTRLNSSH